MKIEVNGKVYTVKLAVSPAEKKKGLQNVSKLDSDEGMLFIWETPDGREIFSHTIPLLSMRGYTVFIFCISSFIVVKFVTGFTSTNLSINEVFILFILSFILVSISVNLLG
jgi:hypothetical protein